MTGLADDMRVAQEVRAQLAAAGIDADDEHYGELLEAETDAPDRLRRIIRASRYVAADAKTLGGMISEMQERKARLERKSESMRATALWGMQELGLPKLLAPDFSASIGAGRTKVVITDEASIPDDACVFKREPSKTAILAMLSEGQPCPGAELSNGAPTLTVRSK